MQLSADDIEYRFSYHPATDEATKEAHEMVRQVCGALAQFLNDGIPDCREKSVALNRMEDVMFWSNAAIARHSGE